MNHLGVSITAAATLHDIFVIVPSLSEAVNNTHMTVLNRVVYREARARTHTHKLRFSQANSFPFILFPVTLQLLVHEQDVRMMSTDTFRG